MSHTIFKTHYIDIDPVLGVETICTLYLDDNSSNNSKTIYEQDGSFVTLIFWDNDQKWAAIQRLMKPFVGKWGKTLVDGVEYCDYEEWVRVKNNFK